MRILLSNDDGISAEGLAALRCAVADLGEVTVIAPATHQSGAGHAITLTELMVHRLKVEANPPFDGIAVEGSPADCTRLAILTLMDPPPELVLSGINMGHNVGVHLFYSGTVAAAAEAAQLGVPAVAFSVSYRGGTPDFHRAAGYCRRVLDKLLEKGLRRGELVNVNIPLLGADEPKGIKVVRQTRASLRDIYVRKESSPAETYEVSCGDFDSPEPDSDLAAMSAGYITITPLQVDMTDPAELDRLAANGWEDVLDTP